MSDRLTDENIAALQRIIDGDDGVRPIMFPWIDRALSELRQHRAAALTAEEVESLRWLVRHMDATQMKDVPRRFEKQRAYDLLTKLTAGEGGGSR